jgi:predicted dinucleotide-binding enzyme
LKRREGVLLHEYGDTWKVALPALPEELDWGEFRRGFVDEVKATRTKELIALQEVILAAIPLRRLLLIWWEVSDSLAGSLLLGRTRGWCCGIAPADRAEVLSGRARFTHG